MQPARNIIYRRWYHMRHVAAVDRLPICESWATSLDAFIEAVGPPASDRRVLCLRDRTKGFVPNNVFWGTRSQRAKSLPHSRLIEYRGRVETASAWARELGIQKKSFYYRLDRNAETCFAKKGRFNGGKRNRPAHASSNHFGVSWRKQDRQWEARIRDGRRVVYLGLFRREADAALAVRRELARRSCEAVAASIRRRLRLGCPAKAVLPMLRSLLEDNCAKWASISHKLRKSLPAWKSPWLSIERGQR